MALVLNEQQSMLRESVRDFLGQEAPVVHLRQLRDQRHAEGVSRPLWRQFGYMGFAGTLVPEAQGGVALGHTEAGLIMEEIGRNLTPSPFWSTAVVGATALRLGAGKSEQQVRLPAVAAGEAVLALAIDERGKHDPARTRMTARRSSAGFVLDGTKTFVVDGHIADALVVVARTDPDAPGTDGLTLFLVDARSPGIAIERTSMVDSHNAARIRFDQVAVPSNGALGEPGRGWELLAPVLEAGRAALAAEQIGVADEAFARTLAYLMERVQFGRRIGEFQALQHRAARLFTQIELARSAVLKAAQALDAGWPQAPLLVAVAKAKAGSVSTLAVQEAVQMHGGMGVTDELDLGLFMKRARVLEELLGDHRFHASRIATFNGY